MRRASVITLVTPKITAIATARNQRGSSLNLRPMKVPYPAFDKGTRCRLERHQTQWYGW